MKTITQIRDAFWENHPQFKTHFRKKWRQNQYNTDIRTAFCDYVDSLFKQGEISESLAQKVTL